MRTTGCSRSPFPSGTGTSKKPLSIGYGNKQQAGSRNPFSFVAPDRDSAQFLSSFVVVVRLPLRATIYIFAALSLGRDHYQHDS